jgi:hypothetical protein
MDHSVASKRQSALAKIGEFQENYLEKHLYLDI